MDALLVVQGEVDAPPQRGLVGRDAPPRGAHEPCALEDVELWQSDENLQQHVAGQRRSTVSRRLFHAIRLFADRSYIVLQKCMLCHRWLLIVGRSNFPWLKHVRVLAGFQY